jgi:hypothetical protein
VEAVTIHDMKKIDEFQMLAVDLFDILRLCEQDVLASFWRLSYVDCLGEGAGEFMRLGQAEATISGSELFERASRLSQVFWGDFEAYRPNEQKFWLVVRAIDGSLYVVITADTQLLDRVRSRFNDVRPSPEDAEYAQRF